jgi:hypothetical protein
MNSGQFQHERDARATTGGNDSGSDDSGKGTTLVVPPESELFSRFSACGWLFAPARLVPVEKSEPQRLKPLS